MKLVAAMLPLVLCALLAPGGAPARWAIRLAPLAAVPPLWVAFVPGAPLDLPVLMLGSALQADAIARPFLLLVGLAWLLSGTFALTGPQAGSRGFWLFWCATLAGVVLAVLAADMVTFYTGYVLLTLASYGLIVHRGIKKAFFAGKVYLILALAGEAMVLSGLFALAARFGNAELAMLGGLVAESDTPIVVGWLLLGGFAVKMGIVPLHFWLPLAHPVAPVPASAVLSGVIVKAGLLGWLRLVPPELLASPTALTALAVLGLLTAFYGAVAGLSQSRLKTVLAYSTVSQMGLLLLTFGALLAAGRAEWTAPLIGLLVLHHGLNKAALFLSAGCSPGLSTARLLLAGVPALALAGAPLTTGYLAKASIKEAAYAAGMGSGMAAALTLSSLATALLMLRFLQLARDDRSTTRPAHPAWVGLTLLGAGVPSAWAWHHGLLAPLEPALLWESLWPLLAAGLTAWAWLALSPRFAVRLPVVPEGDVVSVIARLSGVLAWKRPVRRGRPRAGPDLQPAMAAMIGQGERLLSGMPGVGTAMLAVIGLLWWLIR